MNVLITGATSGIGFLTGITLAYRKHNVYMTTHTKSQLETLNRRIKNLNIKINTFKLDITDKSDLEKINNLDIDILINHAGIGIGGSIIDLDINKLRENFEVNFFSSFRLLQMFSKKLIKENKEGKIIITSSIAGIIPIEFLGSYCSSKAAITMMTKCLNKELNSANSNIKVKLIEPGAYKTGFNQVMLENKYDYMNNNSYFKNKIPKIMKKEKLLWKIIEQKNIDNIVSCIEDAITSSHPKFIYRAPFIQAIFIKIYSFLFL